MKVIRFDSVGGASGDMILGAMVALGADRDEIVRRLSPLVEGGFDLQVEPLLDHGITGVQARVVIHADEPHHNHDHDHDRDHDHEHGHGHHHHHHHHHHHQPDPSHHHEHRGMTEIAELIHRADLPAGVRDMSLTVFRRIAEVEAAIHGTTPEKIHFHEIGALDSIIDIVGNCLALHLLDVAGVKTGPLPMGHGVIECAHGTFPSPAPATLALMRGFETVEVDEPFELVTPTGAALLTTWNNLDRVPENARPVRMAYSFGQRKLRARPNLLRATLFEKTVADLPPDTCLVLECNIDDTTPELVGVLMEKLMAAGALDAFTTAIQMKKQRPGCMVTVLCRASEREVMLDLIFKESSTFGVREHPVSRAVLERRWDHVLTPHGEVKVKRGRWKGVEVSAAPEMADCIRIAKEKNLPVKQVYEAALRAIQS